MRPVVVAADLLTPFGHGVTSCWQGLLTGRTTIAPFDRFPTRTFVSRVAALVPDLVPAGPTSFVEQMLAPLLEPARSSFPSDTRLLLATTAGAVDRLERAVLGGREDAADSRSARLLARVREMAGLADPGTVVSAACASSTVALARAAATIANRTADAVLVVAGDSVTEFVYSGFSSLLALDSDPAAPFDARRKGLSLGEAAGYALLMSPERAAAERRPILGAVAGWGLSNDANHMTGPSRDGRGLALAIRAALARAAVEPGSVASISAHGTGTLYNDSMEMKAFRLAIGDKPHPTYSVKGALGHTLGAAGLLEAIVALESLRCQVVPPTANLRVVDPEAEGWVSDEPAPTPGAVATLSTNSGFGGINAALVLTAGPETTPVFPPRTPASPALLGIGWITPASYGSLARGERHARHGTHDEPWLRPSAFRYPVKNFARFDADSRRTLFAATLALLDAGLSYGPGQKSPAGIVGASPDGSLTANLAYFQDYIRSGRTLARGNLFLYTLPTSPLAETAIYCGLQGPLFFSAAAADRIPALLAAAEDLVRSGEAPAMLALAIDANGAVGFVIGQPAPGKNKICDMNRLWDMIPRTDDVAKLAGSL